MGRRRKECGHDVSLRNTHGSCRVCVTERAIKWNREHKERRKEIALAWFYAHHEEALVDQRARRKRPEVRQRDRAYRKAYRKAHPETTTRLWRARWRERHPDLVRKHARLSQKRRYARKKGAIVRASSEQLEARWKLWAGRCWICGAPATEWDHVKPLAKGGAHIPANLRPACGTCNRRKQDKWPFDARSLCAA